ncbi:hypothetical protein [Bradyrhizobium sp. CCBAU 53380]|uniref:hypothetical protein n=1 Tax=Bradyrhizobium sp. CCBAU 53380 TaxID=1325117 RepID=UPI0023045617|nr:hypothetical protein [Bradyrhizobium sp. CCBAU 53380]
MPRIKNREGCTRYQEGARDRIRHLHRFSVPLEGERLGGRVAITFPDTFRTENLPMSALDRWRSFLKAPRSIELVNAELIGRDHQPPLMIDPAKVKMSSLQEFCYSMTPSHGEPIALLKAIEQQRVSSYDPTARLRLSGTDADGVEWSCGWTFPQKVNIGG